MIIAGDRLSDVSLAGQMVRARAGGGHDRHEARAAREPHGGERRRQRNSVAPRAGGPP